MKRRSKVQENNMSCVPPPPPPPRLLLIFRFSSLARKKFEQCKTYLSIRNSIKSNEIDFFKCFRFQCYF